ncbi:MAG: hypothetical protein CM15mV42_0400 [uncultured marine virus]|nr:MAG: hypothetical protein CM15mV42_0400 [uncultured marine virus]
MSSILFPTSKTLIVGQGGSVTFQVPYLIGDGTPVISVIQNPLFGSLTQSATDNNEFTYTHSGGIGNFADTIEFQLSPQVAGECMSTTIVIPIQIINETNSGNIGVDDDVFFFVDTNGFPVVRHRK